MGMYTEISFAADINKRAHDALRCLAAGEPTGEEHLFFSDPRAAMVVGGAGSYYFPQANHFTLMDDDISGPAVSLRANIKNYDGTIEAFLDWIKPHVTEGGGMRGFLGHVLYEEDEVPTLLYLDDAEDAVELAAGSPR